MKVWLPHSRQTGEEIRTCERCGQPTTSMVMVCGHCRLLERIKVSP